jgi:hypothetical protein
LFPTADAARPYSMLGLGDIVIPGKVEPFKWMYAVFYLSMKVNLWFVVCDFVTKDILFFFDK